jgi:hypothetical protein
MKLPGISVRRGGENPSRRRFALKGQLGLSRGPDPMAARIAVRTLLVQLQMFGIEGRTTVKCQGVKWRVDNHTPTFSAEVRNTSTFTYVFMAWRLIKHSANFTLSLPCHSAHLIPKASMLLCHGPLLPILTSKVKTNLVLHGHISDYWNVTT